MSEAKRQVRRLLQSPDFFSPPARAALAALPAKAVIRALSASLCAAEAITRHRAAALLGEVVRGLAEGELEAGREVMRRLIWSLNEESGTMGWGAAEAMAEIMAAHGGLAAEFARLLASLATPGLCALDNPELLAGAIWGLGRLSAARPELKPCLDLGPALTPLLEAPQARLRGLAAWALGRAELAEGRRRLEALLGDDSALAVYEEGRMRQTSVAELARQALVRQPTTDRGPKPPA